jgi:hypothetical protein
MKNKFWFQSGAIMVFISCFFPGCKDLPNVTTESVKTIERTSATGGGKVLDDGNSEIVVRGVCWSTKPSPRIVSDSKTADGSGIGIFTSSITQLIPNTLYYVAAYATNGEGIGYGNDITFTTSKILLSTLTTTAITLITSTSAVSGGNITTDGGDPITARGVCWATTTNPTISNFKTTDGTGTSIFVSNLTSLQPGITYYVKAYATNSTGTAYGNEISFTTSPIVVPTLTTTAVTSITFLSAVSGGIITSDGGATITAKGVCWSTAANPAIINSKTADGTGIGSFTSNLTGLQPGTIYHVRSYASNSAGTTYGNDVSFITSPVVVATLTTTAATSITLTTAISGGNITADGGGVLTAKGVCWSTTANPTITGAKTVDGTGTGIFTSNLSGLQPATIYHVRAYATNSAGTSYGNDISFITSPIVVASLTTTVVTSVTSTTAVSGGIITSDGGGVITARGVCWSITEKPTINNSKTIDGTGTGSFTSNLSVLQPRTTYHVRAYATNSAGNAYGNELIFITDDVIPVLATLTTTTVTGITQTNASSGGTILSDGGSNVTNRGVCWNTSADPTIDLSTKTSDGTGTGTFTSSITGLSSNTTYHVRAYATNSAGTNYGSDEPFVTDCSSPSATTNSATNIGTSSATLNGTVNANSSLTTVTFEYGTTTSYGNTINATQSPVIGSSNTAVSAGITGLSSNTLYNYRVTAVNCGGAISGLDGSFTTNQVVLATLTTTAPNNITRTTASSGGTISSTGGGNVSSRGVCWSTSEDPTTSDSNTSDASGTGSFSSSITGLTANTYYHVRAYAVNEAGTAYGNDARFESAHIPPTVTTTIASNITPNSATSGGNVLLQGGENVTAKGICYRNSHDCKFIDNKWYGFRIICKQYDRINS